MRLVTPSARQAELMRRLTQHRSHGCTVTAVEWVAECTSTNTVLAQRAALAGGAVLTEDLPENVVLIADEQTAGRGRLDRSWSAPAGSAFTGSALIGALGLGKRLGADSIGLVPVAAGLAVIDALDALGVRPGLARLKWPNDVIVPSMADRKLAGVLCEAVLPMVVVGIGLNLRRPHQVSALPADVVARALWLDDPTLGAHSVGVVDVAQAVVLALCARLDELHRDPSATVDAQRLRCDTLNRAVRVEFSDRSWTGTAVDVDGRGQLLVVPDGSSVAEAIVAGDVVHLRTVSGS